MSNLISGKEAFNAWYDGVEVQVIYLYQDWKILKFPYYGIDVFKSSDHTFRIKPKTAVLNGMEIEIPKSMVVDPISGSVGLVYKDLDKAKEVMELLRSIFNV